MNIGAEDVLDGDHHRPEEPEPLDPEDRTKFRTGIDIAVAVLIVVVVLVAGLIIWQSSEFRDTTSEVNANPVPEPEQPTQFPPSLGEAWQANSPATPNPVAVGSVVVTGEGGEVNGRDPLTGKVLWRYRRDDLSLCTISSSWSLAIAVFRTDGRALPSGDPMAQGNCSQFTALDPASGRRGKQLNPDDKPEKPNGGQRHSDAELGTRLTTDGTYLTATGRRLLATYRSDLVQTMEYGKVPAIVNPGKQPRTGCEYHSVSTTAIDKIGVIERCPEDTGDRLTVYRAVHENKADEPDVLFSIVVGGPGARVVAMTDKRTAVVLPDPSRLVLYDETGKEVGDYPLDLPEQDLRGDPDGLLVPVVKGPTAFYWFTGSRTIALHGIELTPTWTATGTLGPGTIFAGRVLIPVRNAIQVYSQTTGELVGTLPVDRRGYSGTVSMAAIGPMVLEQRGGNLVALR